MYNHEPENYHCPFCRIIQNHQQGVAPDRSDVVCSTDQVTAFLALGRWPNNPLDVLIVPNEHIENIYDLPDRLALPLHQVGRSVALALKAIYGCDGTAFRQHNEPAGNQDVWHYHIHLTPRFAGDRFYQSQRVPFPEDERLEEARKIREYMKGHRVW